MPSLFFMPSGTVEMCRVGLFPSTRNFVIKSFQISNTFIEGENMKITILGSAAAEAYQIHFVPCPVCVTARKNPRA